METDPSNTFDPNPIKSTLKAVPTINFLRLEDTSQLPILQLFSIDQTIYYNKKFYTQEACLLWNTIDYDSSGWLEMFINIHPTDGFSINTFCSDGYSYNKRKITKSSMKIDTHQINSISIGPIGGYIDEIMIFNYTRPYLNNVNCVLVSASPSISRSVSPTPLLEFPTSATNSPSPPPSPSISPNLSFLSGPVVSNEPILPSPSLSPHSSPLVFNSQIGLLLSSSPNSFIIPSIASSPPQRSIAVSAEVNTTNTVGIPNVVEVTYLPSDFTSTTGSIVVSEANPELVFIAAGSLGSSTTIISDTVSIITVGTTVSSTVEICLATSQESEKDVCLGYIDESKSPPEWVCEDKCLKSKNNFLCGKTNHLTSFALLFEGLAKNGKCSSQYEYIFGSSMKDFYLIISFAGLAILIAFIIIILYLFTPLRKHLLGKEGWRVAKLQQRSKIVSSLDPSTDVPA